MTFASMTFNPATFKAAKLSKISIATSLVAIVGVTIFQNLFWMSASHPAELSIAQKQALTSQCDLNVVK